MTETAIRDVSIYTASILSEQNNDSCLRSAKKISIILGGPKNTPFTSLEDLSKTLAKNRQLVYYVSCNISQYLQKIHQYVV